VLWRNVLEGPSLFSTASRAFCISADGNRDRGGSLHRCEPAISRQAADGQAWRLNDLWRRGGFQAPSYGWSAAQEGAQNAPTAQKKLVEPRPIDDAEHRFTSLLARWGLTS
jgi:hypothetical protein